MSLSFLAASLGALTQPGGLLTTLGRICFAIVVLIGRVASGAQPKNFYIYYLEDEGPELNHDLVGNPGLGLGGNRAPVRTTVAAGREGRPELDEKGIGK